MAENKKDTWTSDALEKGSLDRIRKRVFNDPTYLESRDFVGDTPLLSALAYDSVELVDFLLQQGADPNVSVEDGYTCLLTAVESDFEASVEIVATLIAFGADVHLTGINGWTPLHMSAARGHMQKAQILINAGADVNHRINIDGEETPLMEAAFTGCPGIVRLLLHNGADPLMRNTINNRTSLEIARDAAEGPSPEAYNLLREENIQLDNENLFDEMNLTSDQLKTLKEIVGKVDLAESYIQNAKDIQNSGDHAEVIQILREWALE